MTRTRGLLLAILAVLVAVWASSSATMPIGRAPESDPAVTIPRARPARSAFELDEVTRRLRERLGATEGAARPPTRNPFRFDADLRAPREPEPARPVVSAAPAPAVPAAPAVSLIGVVDRTVDGQPVRVGVVSMAGQLFYVSAGDRVGTAYKVVAVSADAIELEHPTDGTTRRIALR